MRAMLFVAVLLSLIGATLFAPGAVAQEATPSTMVQEATPSAMAQATPVGTPTGAAPELLFVQSFTAGRLEPAAEAGTATLTLQGPVGETVYFADRPSRMAGTVNFNQVLPVLAEQATDPLNAAIVIDRAEGDAVVIVELLDGTVDAAGTATFNVRVLGEPGAIETDMTMTAEPIVEVAEMMDFGPNHLFIDGACSPWDPRC